MSPQSAGIPLPKCGAYDVQALAWGNDLDATVRARAKIVWFKYAPSGANVRLLAKRTC